MKPGIVFLIVVVLVLFFLFRSDPAKVKLLKSELFIGNKKCQLQIPVKELERQFDTIAELQIERVLLELPNGDKVYFETVDLPAKEAFDKAYNDIVETIFSMKVQELFSTDGLVLYRGDFDVALFYKTPHELVLLYPANDFEQMFIGCFSEGKQEGLRKFDIEPRKSEWSVKQIILDGLINKDI